MALGKPTSVTLDLQEQTKRILSIKPAIEMKVELDLSERQFFGVLNYIRKHLENQRLDSNLLFVTTKACLQIY